MNFDSVDSALKKSTRESKIIITLKMWIDNNLPVNFRIDQIGNYIAPILIIRREKIRKFRLTERGHQALGGLSHILNVIIPYDVH